MIVMVINFTNVWALDFSFEFPDETFLDQEFKVLINSDVDDIYDVKIYIYKDTKEYSEIYDGDKWQSTHYYLKETFPKNKEFEVLSHFEGDTEICVQLRKSGTSGFDKLCEEISILSSGDSNQNNAENNDVDSKNEQDDLNGNDEVNNGEFIDKGQDLDFFEEENHFEQLQKIVLNEPSDASSGSAKVSFMSSTEKNKLIVVYLFSGVCVFIIILLGLKRL